MTSLPQTYTYYGTIERNLGNREEQNVQRTLQYHLLVPGGYFFSGL